MRPPNRKQIIGGIIAVIGIISLFTAVVTVANSMTRGDVGRFIRNQSCGQRWNDTCPGNRRCFTGFDPERVGRNISGARCVEPGYTRNYCGIYEDALITASFPASTTHCTTEPTLEILTAPLSHKAAVAIRQSNAADKHQPAVKH